MLVQGEPYENDLINLAFALREEFNYKKNSLKTQKQQDKLTKLIWQDYTPKKQEEKDHKKYEENCHPLRSLTLDFFRNHVVVIIGSWN